MINKIETPWLSSYDLKVPQNIAYPKCSMVDEVEKIVQKCPDFNALHFLGRSITYRKMWLDIELCAKSLKKFGIKKDDRVAICLPNCPQAIYMFYAINFVGAIAVMIHPLSSENEMIFYLTNSKAKIVITIDEFYNKFYSIKNKVRKHLLILTSISDECGKIKSAGYKLFTGFGHTKVKSDYKTLVVWKDFLKYGEDINLYKVSRIAKDPAVILYTGGSTGKPKGAVLSNLNFNAIGHQIASSNPFFDPDHKMLAIMPIFHGFGLGISIHCMLISGASSILIPRFDPKNCAKLLTKYRPELLIGVPSLFEKLFNDEELKNSDLSYLLGIYSGGDNMSAEQKSSLDKFLKNHGSKANIRQGYGATECVAACCLMPIKKQKLGSIGIPLPDMIIKICKPGTDKEVSYGNDGEICVSGPTVMIGYLDDKKETLSTIKRHKDGLKYLHTGDLGMMDKDGFVYFKQRIKRMIVTNGYNVYPNQIETVLCKNKGVLNACVVGAKDPIRVQKVVAFVVPKKGVVADDIFMHDLVELCKKNVARYALPKEIIFVDDLPKTKVGKVNFLKLQNDLNAK